MRKQLQFLKGWQVVILRPRAQSLPLINAITKVGGESFVLPTITIQPYPVSHQVLITWKKMLQDADMLFVSSQHAVHFAPEALLAQIKQQKNLKIVTMGAATSATLQQKGLSVFFSLPAGQTSEDLIKYPFLQAEQIQGKTVVLLAGIGGRTVVYDTLCARQANVVWMKVYQQHFPQLELKALFQMWQSLSKMAFIVTSVNSLKNFLRSVSHQNTGWLCQQPLIVISQRIAESAKEWGFQHIFVSKGAECDEIILGLQRMQEICDTRL